jgi:hypothetical protein
MFVALDCHAAHIAHVMRSSEQGFQWFGVADWLMLAASISAVEVDSFRHDPGSYLCGAAFEYEDAQAELRKTFVERLTVFAFVWSALESTIDVINPPAIPGDSGKIRRACRYLESFFCTREPVAGLTHEVTRFRSVARECVGLDAVERRMSSVGDIGASGIDLYLVYVLRNQFAHGSIVFPQPDVDNQPLSPHGDLIECATRITLMQIQMLLVATLGDLDEPIYCSWLNGIDDDEVPLGMVILACHLTRGLEGFQLGLAR